MEAIKFDWLELVENGIKNLINSINLFLLGTSFSGNLKKKFIDNIRNFEGFSCHVPLCIPAPCTTFEMFFLCQAPFAPSASGRYWSHRSTREEKLLSARVWKTLNVRQIFAGKETGLPFCTRWLNHRVPEEDFATHQTPEQTEASPVSLMMMLAL